MKELLKRPLANDRTIKNYLFISIIFLLSLFLISCGPTEFAFDGDIMGDYEEARYTTFYFKKDETSPVAFTRQYQIGKDYTRKDLPDSSQDDVWDMNPGYDLGGWRVYKSDNMNDIELDANYCVTSFHVSATEYYFYGVDYTVSYRTPYTVIIKTQNYDLTGYKTYKTIKAKGSILDNTSVASLLPEVPGFENPMYTDIPITADGKTVVEVLMDRKKIRIELTDSETSFAESYQDYYEYPLSITSLPSKNGYEIISWNRSDEHETTVVTKLPEKYPPYDYTYSPNWKAMLVPYTVYHRLQNDDLLSYTILDSDTETLKGYTDFYTEAKAKNYPGYDVVEPIDNVLIAGDGSTEVTISYNRKTYVLTLNGNGGLAGTEETIAVPFVYQVAGPIPANTFTRTGFTFQGWAVSKERANKGDVDYLDATDYIIGSQNATLWAVWTPNSISFEITIDDDEGIQIKVEEDDAYIYLTAVYPDGTPVPDSDGYTLKWYDSYDMSNHLAVGQTYQILKADLDSGTYQISLIATKSGTLPSGGTVQINID